MVPDFFFFFFVEQVLESGIILNRNKNVLVWSRGVACPEAVNTESDEVGTLRPNESSWV